MFFKQIPAGGGGGVPMENCFPDGSEIYVLVLLRFHKFEFSREKGGSTTPCNSCIELFFQNINTQVDRERGSEPHKFAFIKDIKKIIFLF